MSSGLIKFLQKKVCVQTAVYWQYTGTDAYGNKSYANPVEIKVRWDDQTELIRDDKGKEVGSKAQVQVLQDLDVDSWLYLGSLGGLGSPTPAPENIDRAYKIIRVDKNPLFNSTTEFVRVCYL